MQYKIEGLKYEVMPQKFNKDAPKEILSLCVGGLLYMPATQDVARKIISGEYEYIKSLVFDFEDSLGDDLMDTGKQALANTIQKIADAIENGEVRENIKRKPKFKYDDVPLIFIRVREQGQMLQIQELLGENMKYITGFNIPKFNDLTCREYVDEFKQVFEKFSTMFNNRYMLYMMPILEDRTVADLATRANALINIDKCIGEIAGNILNIRVGGADFCSIFSIEREINQNIHDIAVVESIFADIINVFRRNYIVSGPVWVYFANKENPDDTSWLDGFKAEVKSDMLDGMFGKTCIHPSQAKALTACLPVSYEKYCDAVTIINMAHGTNGVTKGIAGNRMLEAKTHANNAKFTLARARVYGVVK